MTYVIKVKYEDTLRRLSYNGNRPYGEKFGDKLTFAQLEAKIKDLFKIPASGAICVTYTDQESDVVTMADDQDLEDACVLQGLNPLRLNVTTVKLPITDKAQDDHLSSFPPRRDTVPNAKLLLRSLPVDDGKPFVDHVQKVLEGTTVSRGHLRELIDAVVHAITSQIDSPGKRVDPAPAEVLPSSFKSGVPVTRDNTVSGQFQQSFSPQKSIVTGIPVGMPIPTPLPPVSAPSERISIHKNAADREASDAVTPCSVFHTGVQCDVCGMNPIVGPRFKSTKKHDYDLCMSCYKELGNASDYQRIDRPVFRPRHLRCPAFNPNFHAGRGAGLSLRGPYSSRHDHIRQGIHVHGCGGKLDARFVQDVTIFDGTELAPLTSFTKIWRLRNSGTLSWPVDSRLIRVGGDELGNVMHVPLELPENGLPPGDEVEVSVDLVAPEKPGRYVSHWRLTAPKGPRFGHRVWVLIQVVSKEVEDALIDEMSFPATFESVHKEGTFSVGAPKSTDLDKKADDGTQGVLAGHTLFLAEDYPNSIRSFDTDADSCPTKRHFSESPPEHVTRIVSDIEIHMQAGHEGVKSTLGSSESDLIFEDVEVPRYVEAEFPSEEENVSHVIGGAGQKDDSGPTDGVVVDDISAFVNSELGGFSIVDRMDLPRLESSSSSAAAVSSASSIVAPDLSSTVAPGLSNKVAPAGSLSIAEDRDVITDEGVLDEKRLTTLSLCEKLEGMGFSDRILNLQLLEKNSMDLRRTLDEYLHASAEWDPILEELEEMGFYDMEMNRRLMFKNNGSVKRVVKELVQMYKVPVDAGMDNRKGKAVAVKVRP